MTNIMITIWTAIWQTSNILLLLRYQGGKNKCCSHIILSLNETEVSTDLDFIYRLLIVYWDVGNALKSKGRWTWACKSGFRWTKNYFEKLFVFEKVNGLKCYLVSNVLQNIYFLCSVKIKFWKNIGVRKWKFYFFVEITLYQSIQTNKQTNKQTG